MIMISEINYPSVVYKVSVNFWEKKVHALHEFSIDEVNGKKDLMYDLDGIIRKINRMYCYYNSGDTVIVDANVDLNTYIHVEEHLASTVGCNPVVSATYYIFNDSEELRQALIGRIKADIANYKE